MSETRDVLSSFIASTIARDLFNVCTNNVALGEGIHRTVFRCQFDPTLVFKFETGEEGRFANVSEWTLWETAKDMPHIKRWLAPCVAISPNGNVLVQKYAGYINRDHLPKRVPHFFCDLKPSNWGLYEGHAVCRDYGINLSTENKIDLRLKRANWR